MWRELFPLFKTPRRRSQHNVGMPCAAVLGPEERELLPLSEAVLSEAEGPRERRREKTREERDAELPYCSLVVGRAATTLEPARRCRAVARALPLLPPFAG